MATSEGLEAPEGKPALAFTSIGSGRRVVFVHGFTQSGASWHDIAARLAPEFEVVAVDLPGHGGSAAVRPRDFLDAARLLGETGGRASYVGYSLGGRLALTLALERPELVEHLICVGASPGINDPTERVTRRTSDATLARRLEDGDGDPAEFERFLDDWLAVPLFAHLDAAQADRPSRRCNSGRSLASSLRSVGAAEQEPSWSRLAALAMPVCIVTGERDSKFRELGAEMVSAIGDNAIQVVVDHVGHAVPFEAPDRFARLVRDELTRQSRS